MEEEQIVTLQPLGHKKTIRVPLLSEVNWKTLNNYLICHMLCDNIYSLIELDYQFHCILCRYNILVYDLNCRNGEIQIIF
jgi:serine/threonine-protein kinase RIO1